MTGPKEHKVKSLAELPQALEPARDLWPGIEAALKTQVPAAGTGLSPARVRLGQLRWFAAAAVVASVAVGGGIGRDLLPFSGPAPSVAKATAPRVTPAQGANAVDAAFVSDPRYARQRAELLQSLQTRLDAMPEPARAKVTASLATIETAKKDLESALGKDPSNALLQELLINTYQDEMRALTDVHEASDPGRGI